MERRDLLSSFVWFTIAIYVFLTSIRLGVGAFNHPGPGFLLFWSSIFFAFFTFLLVITNLLAKKNTVRLVYSWKGVKWGNVITVIISLIIYTMVLTKLGYLLATLGLMIILFGIGRMKPWVLMISCILTVVLSYFIFYVFLKVPLPRGVIAF